jgi:hypothetical protein
MVLAVSVGERILQVLGHGLDVAELEFTNTSLMKKFRSKTNKS